MKRWYLFIMLIGLVSCKQRFYKASSSSMEETIKMGERFAVTLTDKFERNDIVVFDIFSPDYSSFPGEDGNYQMHWEKRVYRLVAYSGDLVEITNGNLLVNDELVPPPPKAKMRYEVLTFTTIDEFSELDPYVQVITKSGDTIAYNVDLTTEQAFMYQQRKPAIISVKKMRDSNETSDTSYARSSVSGNWSSYNYGPVKIPYPGETITITPVNFKLYHNIPGIKLGQHTLEEKLYFVLGDNFYASADSRFSGLIPHSKMNGVVK